jgi:hypothetical protein
LVFINTPHGGKALICLGVMMLSIIFYSSNSYSGLFYIIYAQTAIEKPEINITFPDPDQQVPIGKLAIYGTSSDNASTKCQVSALLNLQRPYQNVTASGPQGIHDYSKWKFTFDPYYGIIREGDNEIVTRIVCVKGNNNATSYDRLYLKGAPSTTTATTTIDPAIGLEQSKEEALGDNNKDPIMIQNSDAAIAISGDNFYTAWSSNNIGKGNTSAENDIMFRSSADRGQSFGEKINLSNSTNNDSTGVEIGAEGDNVAVLWWERNQTGTNEPVMKVSTNTGQIFGPALRLADNGEIGSSGAGDGEAAETEGEGED